MVESVDFLIYVGALVIGFLAQGAVNACKKSKININIDPKRGVKITVEVRRSPHQSP